MVLDIVTRSFTHGGTTAITRFLIDMPVVPGKLCLIRQVQFLLVDWERIVSYDMTYAMSLDPDDVGENLVGADSRKFIVGRYATRLATSVGFQFADFLPRIYQFPEGLQCPYSRLPIFIQNSNNNAATAQWRVAVFFELVKISPVDLAVAVVRRGRARTRD